MPSSTTWLRCDFVGGGSMTTLRVRKRTSSVEPIGSKRRMIGIRTTVPALWVADDRVEDLLRSSGARLGSAAGSPSWYPGSVVTHSSSQRRQIVDKLREQPRAFGARKGGEELLALHEGLGDRERDALGACVADVLEVNLSLSPTMP